MSGRPVKKSGGREAKENLFLGRVCKGPAHKRGVGNMEFLPPAPVDLVLNLGVSVL